MAAGSPGPLPNLRAKSNQIAPLPPVGEGSPLTAPSPQHLAPLQQQQAPQTPPQIGQQQAVLLPPPPAPLTLVQAPPSATLLQAPQTSPFAPLAQTAPSLHPPAGPTLLPGGGGGGLPGQANASLSGAPPYTATLIPAPALAPQQVPLAGPLPPQLQPAAGPHTALTISVNAPLGVSSSGVPPPPPPPLTPGSPGPFAGSSAPSEVRHTQTEGGPPVENYIPFRFPDLRDQLVDDFPKVFMSQDTVSKFCRLCRYLSLRNTMRLAVAFGDVKDKFAYVDPDNDTEDPGAGILDEEAKHALGRDFEREFLFVLDKGEFDEVSAEQLAQCAAAQGAKGLDVDPCDPNTINFKFWFRGQRKKTIKYSSWKTLYREKEMETTVFQRIALQFSLPPRAQLEAYLNEKEAKSKWTLGYFYKCFCRCHCCSRQRVTLTSSVTVEHGYVYLKLFKDVELADLDMLLPGSQAKFTWFDYLMVWGPILFGCGMAVWKAATGTVRFNNMMDALLSLVLIVMPLSWGIKGYLAVKDKMQQYQAYLADLCLTHNLDNNAGVVSGVLDEAQEQEDNEAMLAYFFLWRGLKAPTPMSKLDLDTAVEGYLSSLIKKQQLNILLDFEVCDSISKLERMGLLTSTVDPSTGVTMLLVKPLEQALEQAHVRNFDENRELAGVRGMGRLTFAAMAQTGLPPWRECEGVFPTTGQRFRYFFNVDTGESTYTAPEAFLPLVSSPTARGMSSALSQLMPATTAQPLLSTQPTVGILPAVPIMNMQRH